MRQSEHTRIHPSTIGGAGVIFVILAMSAGMAIAQGPQVSTQRDNDSLQWTSKVSPEIPVRAQVATVTLDVLVKLREPRQIQVFSVTAQDSPERLRWIADTGDALERDFTPAGARFVERFSHVAVVHLSLPAAALAELAQDPRVESVVPNRKVHKLDATGNAYIAVGSVQPPRAGTGVGIAIVDSGVDYTHPELAPTGVKTIQLYDSRTTIQTTDPRYAKDDNGHGTEVAGIAAALGKSSSAIGVAPAATIVSVKVLDSSGNGDESTLIAGLNAILASVSSGNPHNIRAANMSLGGYDSGSGVAGVPSQPCDAEDPALASVFRQLLAANVVPVVASGNGGCTSGVEWPACLSTSLAVGSVYDQGYSSVEYSDSMQCNASGTTGCTDSLAGPGTIACYTDSGSRLDVWAPTGSTAPTMGGGYDTGGFFGTSASAPYVSGLMALLAEASPGTSATGAAAAIRSTGIPITDPRNGITRNLVQADQAVARLACSSPAAPVGLTADQTSACSGKTVILSWSPTATSTSYTVEVATDPTFAAPVTATTTVASYDFSTTQTTPGTLYFRVQASSTCGASSWSGSLALPYTPQCQVSYPYAYFLSGVARTPGVAPAFWYSDVSVLSTPTTSANLRLTFHGVSATPAPITLDLAAGQQIGWSDVLASLFGITQDKGMIEVESTVPVRVLSRTYSKVTTGGVVETFGQSYLGQETSEALTSTATGYLAGLRSDGLFRTNVELLNTSGVATDVVVSVLTNDGATITTTTATVPALHWVQLAQALPAGHTSAFATLRVLAPGAAVLGSASVIDGSSTDPTTIPMWVR
jgi:subtilisin family serine protease